MLFSTNECAWAQTTVTLLGRKIVGIKGFEIKKGIEKEHLYAAGSDPIDIQVGNKKPEGNIKLLKYEVDLLNDAAVLAGYEDITEVPHDLIVLTVEYKKRITDKPRVMVALGVAFNDLTVAMEQNAKFTEVPLPFICMRVQHILKS